MNIHRFSIGSVPAVLYGEPPSRVICFYMDRWAARKKQNPSHSWSAPGADRCCPSTFPATASAAAAARS